MKKFLTVFFAFTLYFNLISQANAAVGGWDLKNPVAQGASTVYDATKNVLINGKKFIKESSVKITPPASQVAKVLARGGAGYALSVAVEQLLGSVDWVLDPANNQIKYKVPASDPNSPTNQYRYISNYGSLGYFADPASAGRAAANNSCTLNRYQDCSFTGVTQVSETTWNWTLTHKNGSFSNKVTRVANPAYDPEAEQQEKTLPLEVVAAQVISNAESDTDRRAAAQVATTAAAADIVSEAENDNTKARPIASQAEANATTKPADAAEAEKANEAQGEAKPNEANPEATDLSITFPIFCNWAPTICEAAQTVISFPQTLTNWWETGKSKAEEWATSISESWTAVKEWAKSDPPEDTELEIPEPEQPQIDTEIAFGGSCPADHQAEINMGVGLIKMPISYEPICTTVSTAKPVLIFVGFFIAALIIGGVKTE